MTRTLLAMLLVAMAAGPASAQYFLFPEPPDAGLNNAVNYCLKTTLPPKTIIRACETVLKPATLIIGPKLNRDAQPAAILTHIGIAALQLGNSDAAAKYFDVAIQYTDDMLKSYPNNVWANAQRCSLQAIRQTDLEGGLANCNQALANQPADAQIVETKGFMLYRQHKFSDALIAYNAALQLAPKRSSALFMRGVIKKELGDKMFQDDIRAASTSDPNIGAAYSYLGVSAE